MNNVVALRSSTNVDDILIQPKNIEAEVAILGSALVNNSVIDQCPWLEADDFFEPVHGRIWEAMTQAVAMGRRADPISIKRLFDTDRSLTDMDGGAYLARLAHAADSIAVAVEYAREVKSTSRLREVFRIGDEFRARAADPTVGNDAALIIGEYSSQLAALCVDATRPMSKHIKQVIDGLVDRLDNPLKCWSTGIPAVDKSIGGGVPEGYVVGIEARVKSFKSGVAHTLLLNLAMQRVPSCYIALEMGSARLAQRMVGQLGKFNSAMFRHGGDHVKRRVNETRPMLDSLPLWFVDKPGLKFSRLRAEAAQQRMINGTRVFVLDYWQLVRPDGKVTNKADFMAEVADWCAEDAHEHGTTWIVLSQENRAGESLGGDGLARAADYLAQLHKHDTKFFAPGLEGVETLWWDVKFSRDGSSEPIGGPDNPVLYISKHGPHLAEIGQHVP